VAIGPPQRLLQRELHQEALGSSTDVGNFNLFNYEPARLKIVGIFFFQKPETLKRLSKSFSSFIDN
jgi:hypothetical protein